MYVYDSVVDASPAWNTIDTLLMQWRSSVGVL